jgi:predicted porin
MKKLLLATAVAALSVSAANAAPQIYGKAFVTADYVNAEADATYTDPLNRKSYGNYDENTVEINSHASRLGFKGSEAMTANTDLIYQLEYGINVDASGDNTFKSRDTFLGLANKNFGEFRVGRNTSVLDYVNNVTVTEGYWDNLGSNTLNTEDTDLEIDANGDITGDTGDLVQSLNMVSDKRQDNSIVWIAPKYNGVPVELALQYSADESFESNDNGYGASLMFDQGTGFTAGLAYTKDMDANTKFTLFDEKVSYGGDVIRGTVTADLARYVSYPVKVGALYQVADYDIEGAKKEKGLVVSGEMGLTNFAKPASVYLQYNKTDNLAGIDNFDSDQIVLGGKYMFKKNMIAHAYVGQNSADLSVRDLFVDGDSTNLDFDVFALGGGLEYLF